MQYYKIDSIASAREILPKVFADNKPTIIEVVSQPYQLVVPTVQAMKKADGTIVSKPLEDMFPYLPRDVFEQEMIVKPITE